MKIFYKKILIIGGASLILEAIIVYFLYTSINAFYTNLSNKIAFLLTEQVKNVLAAEKINIADISKYNKYPIRRLMKRLRGPESQILHILLIDTTNHIVISDEPGLEGKVYTKETELALLKTDRPTIVNRNWAGNKEEILDIIYPLVENGVKQGYLRTVISVKRLESLYYNRNVIFVVASIVSLGIIMLTVFFTSRIYQSNLKSIEEAIDRLNQSDYQYRVEYQKQDEFAPLFTRLNQLFEKTFDLNESYRKSEERINAMMQVMHEGLLILDNQMKIISYNEYLLNLFQINHRENPDEQIYAVLQNNPRLLEVYRRARDPNTSSVKKSLNLRLPNKATVNVEINALSLKENGHPTNIIFYIKNLGALKELEQNLHRSMRYTVISQLASSVGHEIRNPLSSLAIHTEVVKNLATESIDDPVKKDRIEKSIRILYNEINRLDKLIDQFFNLAKPKAVELTNENINALLREVVDLIKQEATEKNVRLKVDLARGLPPIKISRDEIKQVIINVILNAFDAMPNGGSLWLLTRKFGTMIAIIVKDSGSGIPEDIQDKIFDFYFSTKESGGGIGLAVSKRIIEAHEGKIYFKSIPGKGTAFVIELPQA